MTKSKTCPFCGNKISVKEVQTGYDHFGFESYSYSPFCHNCGATIDKLFRSKEEALAAWDWRTNKE